MRPHVGCNGCKNFLSIRPFTANSTLGEVQASFAGRMFYKMIQKNMAKQFGGENSEGMEEFAKIIDAPHSVVSKFLLFRVSTLWGAYQNDQVSPIFILPALQDGGRKE